MLNLSFCGRACGPSRNDCLCLSYLFLSSSESELLILPAWKWLWELFRARVSDCCVLRF